MGLLLGSEAPFTPGQGLVEWLLSPRLLDLAPLRAKTCEVPAGRGAADGTCGKRPYGSEPTNPTAAPITPWHSLRGPNQSPYQRRRETLDQPRPASQPPPQPPEAVTSFSPSDPFRAPSGTELEFLPRAAASAAVLGASRVGSKSPAWQSRVPHPGHAPAALLLQPCKDVTSATVLHSSTPLFIGTRRLCPSAQGLRGTRRGPIQCCSCPKAKGAQGACPPASSSTAGPLQLQSRHCAAWSSHASCRPRLKRHHSQDGQQLRGTNNPAPSCDAWPCQHRRHPSPHGHRPAWAQRSLHQTQEALGSCA